MQLYPEKYDKLELSMTEKSFLRTIDRAYAKEEMAYYVLHINPRKKDVGNGLPELFNMFVYKNGIILFRFFGTDTTSVAMASITALGNSMVYSTLENDIVDRLEESNYLVNQNGKLQFSLSICFVFPNIDRTKISSLVLPEFGQFINKHCLFADDITAIRKEGCGRIDNLLEAGNQIEEDDVNFIFQRLCPEITIPRKFILDDHASIDGIDKKLVETDRAVLSYRLDKWQIDVVNKINKGNQLILACAGSGKSVLLISKCFKLASLNPAEGFLLTCYNRNLNNYYQWAISQAGFAERNVKCTTFFGLCKQLLEDNSISLPTMRAGEEKEYYDRLFAKANEALASGHIKQRFYGIFIDEVQVFKPEWYRFCYNLLKSKNDEDHYFVIAGDKSQDIKNNIRQGKAPWQGGGAAYPEYRGKTLPIETNYRNSKPINDAIDRYVVRAKILGQEVGVDLISDPELFLRGTAYREGNNPKLVELTDYSNEGEATAICHEIENLIENKGLSEVDIAVILYNKGTKYTPAGWKTKHYTLLPYIKSFFYKKGWESPAILMSGESEGSTYGSRRGVTIASIEGSLGLDFSAVILAGLRPLGTHERVRTIDDFKSASEEKLSEKKEAFIKNINFLYTGCTRAKDELTIILSEKKGRSMYLDLLRESITESN